jgi:uncharacterized protein YbjT (DUF2867 family)
VTLAVTGGTGFVGQALLDRAEREGIRVRALARKVQEPRGEVEWVRGDLDAKDALRQLVRGTEAVIHVAGVVNDAAAFESGNVTGTLNVIERPGQRAYSGWSSSPRFRRASRTCQPMAPARPAPKS